MKYLNSLFSFAKRHVITMGAAGLLGVVALTPAVAQPKKLKVFVSFSYYGNTWMEQNRNMMTALSKSKDYKDLMDLEVQVAGPDAQKQAQQINAMTEAGADVIVVYPISPTALNRAIRNACSRGVVVMTWDSTVDEKCATNVHADNVAQAVHEAQWVADSVKGKGNILMINGFSGAAANDERVKAAKALWAKSPGLKVAAEVEGKWSDPVVREELSKLMAVRKWSDFDVAFAQLGCYPFYALQEEAGIPDEKKIPCAGSAENAERLATAPKGPTADGAKGAYRPMGIKGYTFEVGPAMGAKALKLGVDAKLKGTKLPSDILMPVRTVTQDQVKLCKEGSWKEMKEGCNTFPTSLVPNPESSIAIFDPDMPQLGLKAALQGVPEY
ncbi:substrate-binding domain-containing protein [Variovorax sp. J31P207]|uniref:substrate-binding domain-containing protein n=1 Tax=Variovorax sp. J31P207 TaxID=3053510 RepID=UPI002575C3E5|nr:substrate-binding domain-containing protein [Variovorax sp. J31P207]MDM0071514.1 substrate-binding domain-containing protein [Variovorax sp. J31P207]